MIPRRDFLLGTIASSVFAAQTRAEPGSPSLNYRFFLRIVDAQGTFLRNKDGIVDRLLWHQGGKYQYCPRIP